MFLQFAICNGIHSTKIIKYSVENVVFSIFMRPQNANENVFHGVGNLVT